MICLDYLLAMAANFLYGAGRCVEVWAPSFKVASSNFDGHPSFQTVITDAIFLIIMI
jgi:hypothetical protein